MAIDPRDLFYARTTPPPTINLEDYARQKISEVLRRKSLDRTNYQEPDDTCDCDDFVTPPPNSPTTPRRRFPGLPPRPPLPAILTPPLPPPPARFQAPQIPSAIPPFLAPPSLIFPGPNINIEVDFPGGEDGGEGEIDGGTGATGETTTEPPSNEGGGGIWEGRIACCNTTTVSIVGTITDTQLSLGVEESTHSGDFRNGCYPVCSFPRIFIGEDEVSIGFCSRSGIQICKCYARNNPSNPCYEGNGQVSPPGANLSTTAMFKKILLPGGYDSPSAYYQDNLTST